jgi:hypothetical protein
LSTGSTRRRRWLPRACAIALIAPAIVFAGFVSPTSGTALPPRPTPAVTPIATPTPAPKLARKPVAAPLRLSHIRLIVTPAQDGLWTVVEWQGADGAWHVVEGWQGTTQAGRKRWAVFERNFGEGPYRWVIYRAPDGEFLGTSAPFYLPNQADVELQVAIQIGALPVSSANSDR